MLASSQKILADILTEGMPVLDIGCGTGTITRGIADVLGARGRVLGGDSIPVIFNFQHKLTNRMDYDFHERISIWVDSSSVSQEVFNSG